MPGPIRIHVETDARRAGSELDGLSTKTSRLSSGLKTLGKGALLGLGAGLVGAAAGAVKFAQAAIEDEQAASRMAQTFKTAAGATKGQIAATESWITAQGKALGVADDDLRPALSRLVTATGDVGKAQKLASLAMDVSAGTGKSLEQVSTALMKAQNGQVSSLSRLGINTKNAAGETVSMEEATRRMGETFGGAAEKNANTLGGRMERLKLMASEAGESIGAKMLPYIERFATFVTDKAIPAASRIYGELSDRFGPVIERVGGFIRDQLIPAIKTLAEQVLAGARAAFDNIRAAMARNSDTIAELKDWFSRLWGFVRDNLLPLLGNFYRTVLPAIGDAIGVVIDGIKVWMNIFRTLWNLVLQPLIKLILNAFAALLDSWGALLQALGKVPGFEWAKTAGDKMRSAADQARGLAKEIKDIPPFKKVTVETTYTYSGLRGPGGSGPTRGRDDRSAVKSGYDIGASMGQGIVSGLESLQPRAAEAAGKVGKKIVEALQNRLEKARELRDSIKSLAGSISSSLTGDLFGGQGDDAGTALDKFRASLDAARTTAANVAAATKALIGKGVSKGFLDKLMASGNTELIVQLGGAADAAQLAKAYEGVIATNNETGRLVAEEVIGTRLDSVNGTITTLMQQLADRDKRDRDEKKRPVQVVFTAEMVDQLTRGRQIKADLDAYTGNGGRRAS